MQARIATSVRASITRAAKGVQQMRLFHRESKVGGHIVRSVPVRGDATAKAPTALVHSVVENEELQAAMTFLNISELTEIQVRFHLDTCTYMAVALSSLLLCFVVMRISVL